MSSDSASYHDSRDGWYTEARRERSTSGGWIDERPGRKRTKKMTAVGVSERVGGQQESKSRTQRKLGFWSQQKLGGQEEMR